MKKQELLETVLNNPKTIFGNTNQQRGKFSSYPRYVQVVKLSQDKTSALVRAVSVHEPYWLVDENGENIKDENGNNIRDTRPLRHRASVHVSANTIFMPLRLITTTEHNTEKSFLKAHIENQERIEAEAEARIKANEERTAVRSEMLEVLLDAGIIDSEGWVGDGRYGNSVNVHFTTEAMTRLISLLKSARVEVGA